MTFDELLALGRASLGPVVAVLAVAVAYGQYRIQRYKAKSDLFSCRFDVYQRTLRYVQSARYSTSIVNDVRVDFSSALLEAQFLFDEEVCNFLEQIYKNGTAITLALDAIQRTPPEEELSYRYKIQELKAWMTQAEVHLTELFKPYLRLA